MKNILFVCTGNSCRSIMAEGLLKKYLHEASRDDIVVGSAGVGTIDGLLPAPYTVETMREEGVDVSRYRARVLTDAMISQADYIFVMEEYHRNEIVSRVPKASSKTFLLRYFRRDEVDQLVLDPNVPDPIGRTIEAYRDSLSMIKEEIERIMQYL